MIGFGVQIQVNREIWQIVFFFHRFFFRKESTCIYAAIQRSSTRLVISHDQKWRVDRTRHCQTEPISVCDGRVKKKKEGKGKEAEENLRRPAFLLLVFLALHQTRGSSGVEYSKTYTHVNTSWSGRRV